ncbi:MAG: isochorismatase family protein, partial [Treponema sp.]|nr:isochorismatase family protein [Treponema sp.]
MILLVVDTQRGCFNEKLFAFETVKENIKRLIAEARKNKTGICWTKACLLAFPARPEFGEKDYRDNHSDLDARL